MESMQSILALVSEIEIQFKNMSHQCGKHLAYEEAVGFIMELPNKFDNRKLSMRMTETFDRSFDLNNFMHEID